MEHGYELNSELGIIHFPSCASSDAPAAPPYVSPYAVSTDMGHPRNTARRCMVEGERVGGGEQKAGEEKGAVRHHYHG